MNWSQTLSSTDAKEYILLLSREFRIYPCKVSFTGRKQSRGFFKPEGPTIVVCPTPQLWVIAHEFTHWLDKCRNPIISRTDWHGTGFFHCLLAVTSAIGSQTEYPWNSEYKQIARWWERRSQ